MNNIIRTGAGLAALAVALGAFGAHKLKELVDEHALVNWETAVRYHMYHALGLILIGLICSPKTEKTMKTAGWLIVAGICCFSGSLYLLSLRNVLPFSVMWVWPITPIGGVLFILGWLRVFIPGKTDN
ncbi:MAG: DUF423 domain-containing protein [Bacteroidia bacterium]